MTNFSEIYPENEHETIKINRTKHTAKIAMALILFKGFEHIEARYTDYNLATEHALTVINSMTHNERENYLISLGYTWNDARLCWEKLEI